MSTTRRQFIAGAAALVAVPTAGKAAAEPCRHPYQDTEQLGGGMWCGEYQEASHTVCNGCSTVLEGEVPIPWHAEPEVRDWASANGVEIQQKPPLRPASLDKYGKVYDQALDQRLLNVWHRRMFDEAFANPPLLAMLKAKK